MHYRLVKYTYVSRLEWEDGPGSLENVVEDRTDRVVKEWTRPDDESTQVAIRYAEHFIPCRYDLEDPRIEESYMLERRKDSSSEWEYVDYFLPKFVEEGFDDYHDEHDRDE